MSTPLLPVTIRVTYDSDKVKEEVKKFFQDYELPPGVAHDLQALRDHIKLQVFFAFFVVPHYLFLIFSCHLYLYYPDSRRTLSMLAKLDAFGIVFACLVSLLRCYMIVVLGRVKDYSREHCIHHSIKRIKLTYPRGTSSTFSTPVQLVASLTLPERLFVEDGTPGGAGEKPGNERLSRYLSLYGIEEKSGERLLSDVGMRGAIEECAQLLTGCRIDRCVMVLKVFGGVGAQNWRFLLSIWSLAPLISMGCFFFQACGVFLISQPLIICALLLIPMTFCARILLQLIMLEYPFTWG
ncbi:hypothetical protein FRB95_004902 [Tulasnella sp. JGI-2019a]|nr:hypothetical protein FRB95_004902 [Tulasnella sp. JGI-2019a]